MSDVYRHRYAERSSAPTFKVRRLGSRVIYQEQRKLFSSRKFMPIASPALVALDKNVVSPIG